MLRKKNASSVILVNRREEVLMHLRDNDPHILFPNCWDLIGGEQNSTESPVEAIVRECKEEIGYNLQNPSLFLVLYSPFHIEHVFWSQLDIEVIELQCNEGQRLKFMSINEISSSNIAFNFDLVCQLFFRFRHFTFGA